MAHTLQSIASFVALPGWGTCARWLCVLAVGALGGAIGGWRLRRRFAPLLGFFEEDRLKKLCAQLATVIEQNQALKAIVERRLDPRPGSVLPPVPEEDAHPPRPSVAKAGESTPRGDHQKKLLPSPVSQAGQSLLFVANRWWRAGGTDRRLLSDLMAQSNFPLELYVMEQLDEALREEGRGTYRFRQKGGTPEWLWYRDAQSSPARILAVPLDARRFTGSAAAVLPFLFEGIPKELSEVRFRQIDAPCILAEDDRAPGGYRLVEKGRLTLQGYGADDPGEWAETFSPVVASAARPDESLAIASVAADGVEHALLAQGARLADIEAVLRGLPARWEPGDALAVQLQGLGDRLASLEESFAPRLAPALPTVAPPAPPEASTPVAGGPRKVSSTGSGPLEMTESSVASVPRGSAGADPEAVLAELHGLWGDVGSTLELPPEMPQLGAGEEYLARLSLLEERTRERIARKGWKAHIAHLRLAPGVDADRPGFAPHPIVEMRASSRDAMVLCSCGERLVHLMLFQLVLQLDPPAPGLCAVTLPPGPFSTSNFPAAYQRLLQGPLPTGLARIERIEQPAMLRRSATSAEAYELSAQLEVVFS